MLTGGGSMESPVFIPFAPFSPVSRYSFSRESVIDFRSSTRSSKSKKEVPHGTDSLCSWTRSTLPDVVSVGACRRHYIAWHQFSLCLGERSDPSGCDRTRRDADDVAQRADQDGEDEHGARHRSDARQDRDGFPVGRYSHPPNSKRSCRRAVVRRRYVSRKSELRGYRLLQDGHMVARY